MGLVAFVRYWGDLGPKGGVFLELVDPDGPQTMDELQDALMSGTPVVGRQLYLGRQKYAAATLDLPADGTSDRVRLVAGERPYRVHPPRVHSVVVPWCRVARVDTLDRALPTSAERGE